jgi:hypothetical protein
MIESLRHLRERIIPRCQQQDGYNGFIALGNRETGKVIGISLWESERALQATEEEANLYGRRLQKLLVERYRV